MTTIACPVCLGETFEIRAKLLCRRCGAILETCCEGGPMGTGCQRPDAIDQEGAQPPPPAPPAAPRAG